MKRATAGASPQLAPCQGKVDVVCMSIAGLATPGLSSLHHGAGEALHRPEGPDGPDSGDGKRRLFHRHRFNAFIWVWAQYH